MKEERGREREGSTNEVDLLRELENDSLVGRSSSRRSRILVLGDSLDLRVDGSKGRAGNGSLSNG